MAIDPKQALGYKIPESSGSYTQDQVMLYHLGIGAGVPPTDPGELEYTYEKNLKVLPSFAVIPAFGSMGGIADVPGLEFDFMQLLHGEQEIILHKPLPTSAELTFSAHIAELWDKGKAALAVLESTASDSSGEALFTNRFSLFLRGAGGFGGESGPKAGNQAPERAPDGVVESTTLPQQALIYRLSGDKNPLHCDPEFAAFAGFDTPIIHGLCSYGIACKAVVDNALGGDVTRVAGYQARFAGVGFPGETYLTSYWKEGNKILVHVTSKEREATIISNAAITLR
jgi:acyl dehydratase